MGSHDHLFKVLIVGDGHVGKTSLVHRYVEERFCKSYKSTVGVDFALKVLPWSNTETVRLQLWDIAGQERFTSMTRIYYKEASGCVLMFDVTDPSSFRNCHRWKEDLDSKVRLAGGSPVPCILLANKCDLSPWQVSRESVEAFSESNGFVAWIETSVKENKNISESMRYAVGAVCHDPDTLLTNGDEKEQVERHFPPDDSPFGLHVSFPMRVTMFLVLLGRMLVEKMMASRSIAATPEKMGSSFKLNDLATPMASHFGEKQLIHE
ncbi:ras-related protein Rab-7L1-like [Scleropages formosus]|uniref:Ras-related protein Rab n=1 Tax=Scleropages formosus TaxID=113540 RepID=A0A0P7UY39_SCLFO|nr:ras-related protein Rab-7L1-like [Scleropages formosus]